MSELGYENYTEPFTFPARLRQITERFSDEERLKVREGKLVPLQPLEWSGVYVIRSGDCVKIGSARNMALRFADIQCCNPNEIELLAVLSQDRTHERLFHRMFEKHHVRGEWFRLEGNVVDAILVARHHPKWKPGTAPGDQP